MQLSIKSKTNKEIIDITDQIDNKLKEQAVDNGLVCIFLKHTTAALTICEVGEGTEEDLLQVLEELIPKINFRHAHNPAHAPSHMVSSIVGQSLTISVQNSKLDLGTWQRVVLVEENGPRELKITLTLIRS